MVKSLTDAHLQRWILLSYDIWCSYGINLGKRIAQCLPEAVELIKKIRGAVPKMHVKNHIEICQLLWAFDYIPYSGNTHGETIETGWSINNEAAGSTKEMNDGHRHDTLDDMINYYNWTKFHRIGMFLSIIRKNSYLSVDSGIPLPCIYQLSQWFETAGRALLQI